MEPLFHTFIMLLLLFGNVGNLRAKDVYTFVGSDCFGLSGVKIVVAALLRSPQEMSIHGGCSMTFQTPSWGEHFFLRFLLVDTQPPRVTGCLESLKVEEMADLTTAKPQPILEEFCGDQSQLPVSSHVITRWRYVRVTWKQAMRSSNFGGFRILMTAIATDTAVCSQANYFPCDNTSCISSDLRCDGLPHCPDRTDEDCQPQPLNSESSSTVTPITTVMVATPSRTSATSRAAGGDVTPSAQPVTNEVYLWLPLIVVVIFTGVMVTLIMIGRRGDDAGYTSERTSDEQQHSLHLELNGNPGYEPSEGAPETPPPTYEVIARQTSYVSHISQTSDQISLPPGYDEALNLPNDSGDSSNQSRSRLRPVRSRSAVGRTHRSGGAPNWARLFSRSVSATEPPSSAAFDGQVRESDASNITVISDASSVFIDDGTSPKSLPGGETRNLPMASTPQSIGASHDVRIGSTDEEVLTPRPTGRDGNSEHRVSFFL